VAVAPAHYVGVVVVIRLDVPAPAGPVAVAVLQISRTWSMPATSAAPLSVGRSGAAVAAEANRVAAITPSAIVLMVVLLL
jgi:hypothetical protein